MSGDRAVERVRRAVEAAWPERCPCCGGRLGFAASTQPAPESESASGDADSLPWLIVTGTHACAPTRTATEGNPS